MNYDTLEPIQHFFFPPWNKNTPYTVKISNLPKEEAGVAHNSSLFSFGKNDCLVYTDASAISDEKSTGIGVGLVVLSYNTTTKSWESIHQSKTNLGLAQLVYNRELEGVIRGIEYVSTITKPG